MTVSNRLFLLSFLSLVWAFVMYLVLESDVVIFQQAQDQPKEIEATGSMLFNGMSDE